MSLRAKALAAVLLGATAAAAAGTASRLLAQAGAPSAATVRIGVLRGGAYDVVTLPLETYVARVLGGEAAPQTPPTALEALAIAIRTYTATNRGRHRSEGFDLCDQTHCQVMRSGNSVTERAAQATAGQVLLYRGAPATVYYSASCGGRSEKPSNVWPGSDDPPYLSIHDDDGCEGFPQWSAELALSDLQRALAAAGYHGRLRDVRVGSRNDSGRVARLTLDGMTPREISGQDLRMVVGRTLGFQHLQSTTFELSRAGSRVRFKGRGAGHGVGLCVIGSMKLAAAGQSAAAILRRYFPGTQIGVYGSPAGTSRSQPAAGGAPAVVAGGTALGAVEPAVPRAAAPSAAPRTPAVPDDVPGDVDLVLPPSDARDRSAILGVIVRARTQMAQALGLAAPPVRVRFHASTEAFERATERPWFVLGAVVGGELQFVPVSILRSRGVLDRMMRHQVARLLIGPVLDGRPEWVREGAALYFSDPDAHSSARGLCPQDAELQRPLSVGAFGEASARAQACFERRLGGNKDWRTIR